MISDRAKRLDLALPLHELWGNEARRMVIQAFLNEERREALVRSTCLCLHVPNRQVNSEGDGEGIVAPTEGL